MHSLESATRCADAGLCAAIEVDAAVAVELPRSIGSVDPDDLTADMAISKRTYAEEIYLELRDEILSGRLRPGDRLAEVEVAQRMGTSQGPVREAFARLREQGLLISFRHRGSYVSEISEEEARHTYRVRGAIEPLALKHALPLMGDSEFAVLEDQIRTIEAAAKAGDIAANVASDMQFHRYVYQWSGSTTLLQCWDVIEANIRKFAIVASPPVFKDLLRPARSHYTLLKLMRTGYSPELEQEVDRHLKDIWLGTEAGLVGHRR